MNVSLHPYSIHLKQALITGGGTFQSRDGWIVRSFIREHSIFSEISPLPGFSTETKHEVFNWLTKHDCDLKKHILDRDWINEIPFASIRFGLDVHRLQILATADGKPLHRFLNPKADSKVKTNGLITIGDPIQANEQIKNFLTNGIQTIKCKVGIKPSQELNLIRMYSKNFPDVKWRLDANQAFNVEQAIDFLNALKGFPIEYCEQPVLAHQISELKQIRDAVSVRIAVDESANSVTNIMRLIEQNAADVIVIKPMLIGSVLEIQSVIELIQRSGLKVIFSTALESVVGRRVVAQIAAAFTQNPNDAHGLGTGYLFKDDLDYISESLSNGYYNLSESL